MKIKKVIKKIKKELGFKNSPSCELLFHQIDYDTPLTNVDYFEAEKVRNVVIEKLQKAGFSFGWVREVLTDAYLLEPETEIGDITDEILTYSE